MEWSPRATQRDSPRRPLQQQPPPPPHHPLAGGGTAAAAATHISRAAQSDDGSGGLKRKPPYSYSTLISFAINSSPTKKMTLSDIYTWICANFPFYREAGTGWKVGARDRLGLSSLDRPFVPCFRRRTPSITRGRKKRSRGEVRARARRFQAPTLAHGMKRFAIAAFGCLCFFRAFEAGSCGVDLESRTTIRRVATLGAAATLLSCNPRNHLSPVIVV